MLIKTIFVFLLAMAAVGMIGNALTKGGVTRNAKKRLGLRPATRCRRCGRYVIGTTGCDCDKKG